jgi:acetyl esterase/lipase
MKIRSRGLAALGTLATAVLLASCGGSGGGSSGGVQLEGFAATGAALAAATVDVKCQLANGTATTNADGSFTVTIPTPGQPPCLLRVTKGGTVIHGIALGNGRVNVTPITDLVVAQAAGGDPAKAFADYGVDKAAGISSRVNAARDFVKTQVAALAGAPVDGDPLTKPFKVGDADDKVLDALAASLATAGKTLADLRTAAAAGTDLRAALPPEETRPHDDRTKFPYAVIPADASATTFAAMAAAQGDVVDMSTTTRVAGVLQGAAYRIEVPANWNGELVMYAHGYAGEGLDLKAVNSAIRRHLIQNGYAWAASSYSKNSYDVKAGIEDTNLLANNFATLVGATRKVDAPSRYWIIGHSMGGHIAAAAVEAETYATSVNKVQYAGSMPMCGVVGDTTLFDTFTAMQAAAHVLAGKPNLALDQWLVGSNKADITAALFSSFPSPQSPTAPMQPNGSAGLAYFSVLQNLTGGTRPLFDLGYGIGGSFAGGPYGVFGTTTVTTGLTTKPTGDTSNIVYKVDGNETVSAQLNALAPKATAPADANRLRRDGLRWIPKVNGQMQAPVLTLHTLGDLFVPFSMEQVYRTRADANGNGNKLVQRAIRGISHCDFTVAEMKKGFDDLVSWVKTGTRPAGDDVTTAATVAATNYGCTFTNDTLGPDESTNPPVATLRVGVIKAQNRLCPNSVLQPAT